MWGLVDCDNFFCSCERVFRPGLAGRPVVVLSNNDGCVIARSSEAKAMGVKMGMPYYQMRQQFGEEGIEVCSGNHALYGDMSARVMSVLRSEAPILYQYSVDEAFVDFEGMDMFNLKDWGERVVKKVAQWTGIPVSIGIAPTKTLAKLAANFAKKYAGYNKCCMISSDSQRQEALRLTEIRDVWGIGRRLAKSLMDSGVSTAMDFASCPRGLVAGRYHLPGERMWLELHGIEAVPTERMGAPRKSIMVSRTLHDMVADFTELSAYVADFAAACAVKLRRQGSACGLLTVFVDSNRFRTDLPQYHNSANTAFTTPTSATTDIVSAATGLLAELFREGVLFKRAGVMVSYLCDDEARQPDLFDFNPELDCKRRNVSDAIDRLNCAYGRGSVVLASQERCDVAVRDGGGYVP